ncbi:MAG: 6,7-dimethyl-8-ribityllumazine synthase [Deltaproteobacteria bacterium RIFCSPLOWO2_02_FULL_44_10]|nr:MAG: 6,7-dimethyl-8-ribityllumazine synthase [Deltaproteobacteria bacterium RIFCSPHIGHO2_02_FULL_44_16]OGQ46054.1 MAG: 6,7-dimethyl-8-ribityllumazine synthase [Deltaproteobacteria bacterium RIFCSPLOWO2_02_FULL_44_10]
MRVLQGDHTARDMRIAIVVSRFNASITDALLQGALSALEEHGCRQEQITVAHVPGALEIPITAKKLASTRAYDAILCLGAVVRGETYHFEIVANETSRGMMQAMLETNIPMTMGVITVETMEQAQSRSSGKMGNKGYEAALGAIEMVNLLRQCE